MPAERYARMVDIFIDELPGDPTFEEVSALLVACSARLLLHAFAEGLPQESWMSLVVKATQSDIRIVPETAPGIMRLTGRGTQFEVTEDWVQAKIEKWFRFELPPGQGWLAALQWGPEGWYAIELGERRAIVQRGDQRQRVPAGRPYLIENNPVARRYLFIQADAPFTPHLSEILNLSATSPAPLDASTLIRLAALKDQANTFEVTSLDIAFNEETDIGRRAR